MKTVKNLGHNIIIPTNNNYLSVVMRYDGVFYESCKQSMSDLELGFELRIIPLHHSSRVHVQD